MTDADLQRAARLAGVTLPVHKANAESGRSRCFWKLDLCCSARGLVGAKKSILELGSDFRRKAVSIEAIRVLPSPVGRTTREFFWTAVAKMDSWYRRGETSFNIKTDEAK